MDFKVVKGLLLYLHVEWLLPQNNLTILKL